MPETGHNRAFDGSYGSGSFKPIVDFFPGSGKSLELLRLLRHLPVEVVRKPIVPCLGQAADGPFIRAAIIGSLDEQKNRQDLGYHPTFNPFLVEEHQ